jgi:outer membrane protein assembly factor BamB
MISPRVWSGALALALSLACAVSIAVRTASADWPAMRHDARRTARGTGRSRIDRPALAFRFYLGGALGNTQYVAHDVDGDGAREILFLMGGRLVAKTPGDLVVWETPALDLVSIAALGDLNGDGAPEVVCPARAGRLYVIEPRNGTVRWTLPSGVVGNVGAVRLATFDDAPGLDLYVADNACGSTGSLGDVGRAYSFARGFDAPTVLFDLESSRRDYVCGVNDTVVDIDGDGRLEVIAQGLRHFYVYSAVDGHLMSTSEDVGSIPFGLAQVVLAQADDDPPPELVCFTENTYAPPINSRRVFLMDWDAKRGTLVRRWEHSVADPLNDRHGYHLSGVADLGGDGSIEVVTSFYDGATRSWTTRVYDVRNGAELASLNRGPFRGLVDLDGDGTGEILVGDTTAFGAYRFTGTSLVRLFLQPGFSPVYAREWRADDPATPRDRPLAIDLDGDGRSELLAIRENPEGTTSLVGLSAMADPPVEVARLDVEHSVTLLAVQLFENVTRRRLQPAIVRSDGYLWILDERLRPTNAELAGEISERGMRIGGYYSGPSSLGPVPIATDLDGRSGDEILVRDSRGVLLQLDAQHATLIEAPRVMREVPRAELPVTVDLTGDGRPEVITGLRAQPDAIVALREDGTELWRTTVGTMVHRLWGDLIAGDVSGDGTPDVVFHLYSSSGGTVAINVLDGRTGSRLWGADYETVVAGSGLGLPALFDPDGDARLDLLVAPQNTFTWLSAVDGRQLASVDAGYPGYGVFHDLDADGTMEIMVAGAVYGVGAYELDLSPVWQVSDTLHTRVYGAVADCPDGPRFVQGHFNSPRVSVWNARTGAVVGDLALLEGRAWEPPSSAPDRPGVVGNVTIAPDLSGDGRPIALVPSTDGHLYALDPCTLVLRWALDFRYPVGEAILADPDGDGFDEIVVTVADGFLYGIDREVLPAPAYVYENDGTRIVTRPEDDVDELVTSGRLHANWAAVPGATAYEYAVITPGGAFVTRPNFVNVGLSTAVTTDELPLRVGQRYLFAVRAIGTEGSSSEALSDGVVVLSDPCASCTADEVCREGRCVADPCAAVSCPPPLVCVMGSCETIDGGSAVETDAGARADAGSGAPTPTSGGGCCSVGAGLGRPRSAPPVVLVLFGTVLLLRRRSHRSAGRGPTGTSTPSRRDARGESRSTKVASRKRG